MERIVVIDGLLVGNTSRFWQHLVNGPLRRPHFQDEWGKATSKVVSLPLLKWSMWTESKVKAFVKCSWTLSYNSEFTGSSVPI